MRSTTVYDAIGRISVQINPLNQRTSTVYAANGSFPQVERTDPLGNTWITAYDQAGRDLIALTPLGATLYTKFYDAVGRLYAVRDTFLNYRYTRFDAASRVVATITQLGFRTSYVYDNADQPIATVDPLLRGAMTVYDSLGRVSASIAPDGGRTTPVYDAAGRVIASVNPLGNRWKLDL